MFLGWFQNQSLGYLKSRENEEAIELLALMIYMSSGAMLTLFSHWAEWHNLIDGYYEITKSPYSKCWKNNGFFVIHDNCGFLACKREFGWKMA